MGFKSTENWDMRQEPGWLFSNLCSWKTSYTVSINGAITIQWYFQLTGRVHVLLHFGICSTTQMKHLFLWAPHTKHLFLWCPCLLSSKNPTEGPVFQLSPHHDREGLLQLICHSCRSCGSQNITASAFSQQVQAFTLCITAPPHYPHNVLETSLPPKQVQLLHFSLKGSTYSFSSCSTAPTRIPKPKKSHLTFLFWFVTMPGALDSELSAEFYYLPVRAKIV